MDAPTLSPRFDLLFEVAGAKVQKFDFGSNGAQIATAARNDL